MQTARRMRFSMARKLLSTVSNEDALKWFDRDARTLRCRAKIFFCAIGNFKTRTQVRLPGVLILRLRDLGKRRGYLRRAIFGERS